MKKIISICTALFLAFTISMVQQVNAQDYLITFAGTGASTTVSSVEVENLSTGAKKTLNGGDILHLTSVVGISQLETNSSSEMRIYPNPMMDNSIIAIHPQEAGEAIITVYEMTGKTVAKISTYLENGRQEFRLSGLKNGLYLISARGNSFQYSGKILSSGQAVGNPGIEKVSGTDEARIEKISKKEFNQTQGTVDMYYIDGERLKFKASSGIYSTVKTDIPTRDKTLSFNFVPCTDGDNNNYPVVDIGGQIWIAENLKTSKYNDSTAIPLVIAEVGWTSLETSGFCWYNYDSATYHATYGALYNWYSVNTGKLCPEGFHVPTWEEWNTLTEYLGNNAGGKLLEAGLAHWADPNQDATNESGFTALPGGYCYVYGTFDAIGYDGYWWSSSETVYSDYLSEYVTSNKWNRSRKNSNGYEYSLTSRRNGYSVRCLMAPLTTQDVTEITTNKAIGGGEITNDWGIPITARGVCWSSIHTPTVSDSLTSDGTGTGAFTSLLTGLQPNLNYFIRAYATSSLGTVYGNQINFKTMTGQVTDIDNNTYYTVTIGTQVWIAENLKTTQLNDGTEIPLVKDSTEWIGLSTPGLCWYNNDDTKFKATYGALYNWYSVNTGKLCPAGWHVPTWEEWNTLTDYLGNNAGGKLLEAGLAHWANPKRGGTNESGFTALPGGSRYLNGSFNSIGFNGYWWSSTENVSITAWCNAMGGNASFCHPPSDKQNGFSARCLRDFTFSTQDVVEITNTTALSGGNITNYLGNQLTVRGVCWSSMHTPTISDSLTSDGTGTGTFTSSLTGLTENTKYYIRAYATNSEETIYGNEIMFATKGETGSVCDIDGNTYTTIEIGTQTWMAENLKTTRFNDGTSIPLLDYSELSTPGYCWLNNDETTFKPTTYGALYNWYSVNTGKLCPSGWHVPADGEWNILINYLGGEENADGKLKEAGLAHWDEANTGATNESGFTALPGGYRDYNSGSFVWPGDLGYWWSSTGGNALCAWYLHLQTYLRSISRGTITKRNGFSVRCLKDE